MRPQGLNLNEYGIESGVTAPQARNFAFLSHRSVKISLFFFHFLFTRSLARLSFRLLGKPNDSLGDLGGGWAWPLWPPGSVSDVTQISIYQKREKYTWMCQVVSSQIRKYITFHVT